jgi:hypothetical protein
MKLYYKIAKKVAFHIQVYGLDRQDKVQECVIKAWQALGEHPTEDLSPLIYRIMKNHLIDMSRPTYNERKTTSYAEDIAVFWRQSYRIVIPLPSYSDERVLVVAWLESDGRLIVACETIGINYWTGLRIWHKVKDSIRRKGYDSCMLEEDQCWLRAI